MFFINNLEWRLYLVSPDHPVLLTEKGTYALGVCDNMTKTVFINDSLDDIQTWKVLCHEITHAAMFSYGVALTLEQEEILADLVATYGHEIIEITNLIFSKLKGG